MICRTYNVRGIVGEGLNERVIKNFEKNVVRYLHINKLANCVIIGKDNRVSSDYIFNILSALLISNGIEVQYAGEVTTPELVFLGNKFNVSLSIMISASHNPWQYNGFKCFDAFGQSVDITDLGSKMLRQKYKFSKIVDMSSYKELYIRKLKNSLKCKKINCIFDCANGAVIEVVRKVFPKQKYIGADNSGRYINDTCGTQNIKTLANICKKQNKIGFAFDGDGDRVIAVDENGNIIDGDKILYILATQYLGEGDKVVGTILSSSGLEISLRRKGIRLVRERVGAKYVSKRMKQDKICIGGEKCGHIFLNQLGISDGVQIAIELINILNRTHLSFQQLLVGYKENTYFVEDIEFEKVKDKDYQKYNENEKSVRVIIRKSETENVLRIVVEGDGAEEKMKDVIAKLTGEAHEI